MSKWKCGICNSEFDNFQAQGFGETIYCPLCYFKELYRRTKLERDRLNNIINELEEYIKPYLYMLNGIQDRDIYEQCQLDDFTNIMEKLQELKENNEDEC